jgi:hypothetical protein
MRRCPVQSATPQGPDQVNVIIIIKNCVRSDFAIVHESRQETGGLPVDSRRGRGKETREELAFRELPRRGPKEVAVSEEAFPAPSEVTRGNAVILLCLTQGIRDNWAPLYLSDYCPLMI